jgi:hypothetical protein
MGLGIIALPLAVALSNEVLGAVLAGVGLTVGLLLCCLCLVRRRPDIGRALLSTAVCGSAFFVAAAVLTGRFGWTGSDPAAGPGDAPRLVSGGPTAGSFPEPSGGKQQTLDAPLGRTCWLGRKPDRSKNEYVFDVAVPAALARVLTCDGAVFAKFQPGVRHVAWEIEGKTYTFVQNPLAWEGNRLDQGVLAFARNGVSRDAWTEVSTAGPDWKACQEQLKAQAVVEGTWHFVTPTVLQTVGNTSPNLTVNFDADRPYNVTRDPPTRKPQIVPVVHDNQLYITWHSWGGSGPTDKIIVSKIGLDNLAQGPLSTVREVPSKGTLVGFTIDGTGADHVLSARAEEFANTPDGHFVDEVHQQWRPNVLTLHSSGRATDLNSDRFTVLTFYGLTNAGSGRLLAGGYHLAAVFARRHFSPRDNLIHQEANALLVTRDLSQVPIKADNTVSHSFDQRLIFDGTDFVTLNQGDAYPHAGLTIEKVRTQARARPPTARFLAYACPTFGNDVYFDLGGLAAEPDGYPVLFLSTRNTGPVREENAQSKHHAAWDLAMVYVVRDFESKSNPANPYDVNGSGILAAGYAPDEEFTVNNFTWNPNTSRWDKPDPRTIKRRVFWLTQYNPTTRASRAKFVKLHDGQYVAIWEEHTLAGNDWHYATTRALAITSRDNGDGRSISKGRAIELEGLRLHEGDDALALPIHGVAHAAWVTAGATNKQLLVQTLDANLAHKSYVLKLP